jgi:hypothetical protein
MMTAHPPPCTATNIARSRNRYSHSDEYCIRAANHNILTDDPSRRAGCLVERAHDAHDPNRSSNKFDMRLSIFFANKSFRFGNFAPGTIAT